MLFQREHTNIHGYDCSSSAVANYLYDSGIDTDSSLLILLGDGIYIRYDSVNKCIEADVSDAAFQSLKLFHYSTVCHRCSDYIEASNLLENAVIQERYFSIMVSTDLLDYASVYKRVSSTYHYINIIGIESDKVYVRDGCVPAATSTVFEGWVGRKSIMKAWERGDFEYFIIEKNENGIIVNINKLMYKQIEKGISSYINGSVKDGIYYGEEAIKKLLEDIKTSFLGQEKNRNEEMKEINYQLKVYGFITLKEVFSEIFKMCDLEKKLVLEYDSVAKEWNTLCLLFIKAGYVNKYEYFFDIYNRAINCIMKEREVLSEIYKSIAVTCSS